MLFMKSAWYGRAQMTRTLMRACAAQAGSRQHGEEGGRTCARGTPAQGPPTAGRPPAYLLVPVGVAVKDKDGRQEVEVVDGAGAVEQKGARVHGEVGAALPPPDVALRLGVAHHALVLGGAACAIGRDEGAAAVNVRSTAHRARVSGRAQQRHLPPKRNTAITAPTSAQCLLTGLFVGERCQGARGRQRRVGLILERHLVELRARAALGRTGQTSARLGRCTTASA